MSAFEYSFYSAFHVSFAQVGHFFVVLMSIFIVFFMFVISYVIVRMRELRKEEHERLHHEIEEFAHHQAEREQKKKEGQGVSNNPQWNRVLELLFSQNPSDWKLSIIEADLMLEKLADQVGLKGDNLGEKLKSADPEHFFNLSTAWEAHLIRNRIAHEGDSFPMPLHEAKRVIALYEAVFRSFGFI